LKAGFRAVLCVAGLLNLAAQEAPLEQALKLIDSSPADEAALAAMAVVLKGTAPWSARPDLRQHERIAGLLLEYHLDQPRLLHVANFLVIADRARFWETVHSRSPNPHLRGNAALRRMDALLDRANQPGLEAAQRLELRDRARGYADDIRRHYAAMVYDRGYRGYTGREGEHGAAQSLGSAVQARLERLKYAAGAQVPDMRARTLSGEADRLSRYRGRVILLDFWATWCHPCVEAHPQLAAFRREMSGRPFELIAVSVDASATEVESYLANAEPLPWVNWYIGPDSDLIEEWGIKGYPTYMVIDAAGVMHMRDGAWNEATRELIRELVRRAEQPAACPAVPGPSNRPRVPERPAWRYPTRLVQSASRLPLPCLERCGP
jgi:thiol-disulfide isomerase/thioredoxin